MIGSQKSDNPSINSNKTALKHEAVKKNFHMTLTETVKCRIREVLEENLRKSLQKQTLSEVNNKISVIKNASDLNHQWSASSSSY